MANKGLPPKLYCCVCGNFLVVAAEHLLDAEQQWPKTCSGCGELFWDYLSASTSVVLQPVFDERTARMGVVVVNRIMGKKGWCLPSGFISPPHSWQVAGIHELHQEASVHIPLETKLKHRLTWTALDAPPLYPTLIFGEAPPIPSRWLDEMPFVKNTETDARRVVYEPEELVFSSHTFQLSAFFRRHRLLTTLFPFPRTLYYASQLRRAAAEQTGHDL